MTITHKQQLRSNYSPMGISVIYSPTSTISYKEEEPQKKKKNNNNNKPLSSPLGLFLGFFLVILASFFPGLASFNPIISALQTIFTEFLCLSSLSIFQSTGPSMRRSLKKTASVEGSSAAGKYNRMKNAAVRHISSDDDAMPRSPSMNRSLSNSQDHLLTPPGGGGGEDSSSDLSPMKKSPWSCHLVGTNPFASNEDGHVEKEEISNPNVLMGSLVREEGHVYSLATHGDLLYTGSDSKNIRVWKNQKEFSGFKSNSGLIKAIVIAGDRIFTGHQDGKIRVWKISSKNPSVHKRVETLPTFKNYIKSSLKPGSYVTEARRKRNNVWIKHLDAISCLGLSEDKTILYSASWDKTFKVWKISSSKCLESVTAHDDAVNCLVAGFDGLVFTGSADGTVKVWRRELQGKGTKHFFSQTLLKQECAVTALAVNPDASIVYCGSSDGMVNFWERERHLSHGGVLRGHKLAVLCLVTAGNLVISGSADTGICVWRRMGSDHICLSLLNGHTGPVKCLAAEKDNEPTRSGERKWILYSGSLDKSVKMWRVSEHAPPMGFSGTGSSNSMPAFLPSAPSFSSQGMVL